jgi:flagellar M-ring protein FliF
MPVAVTSALRRLLHALREFTVGQRTIAIIGLAAIVVGAIGLTAWLTQPNYSPLFTSLSATDANSITQLLHTDNVPYQLADGGSTILVPEGQVDAERLKAASAGLPSLSEDEGYGLLDKLGVTASQFEQTTTYQRALQGELATTIEAMDGVQTASVKLAIPAQSVFDSQQVATTASVFIQTQGGITLTTAQVQAITHLTAASVDNLTAANVSVISADGTLLSGTGSDGTGSNSTQTATYESHVQSTVQAMLDRVLGAGNSTVVVAADLSAQSAKQTSQTYTAPTNPPAINEQGSSEVYSGTNGSSATGVLGPDNIAVPAPTSTAGSYNSQSLTKNNAIDSTTETRTIPAGALNRQTVSVAVNKNAVKGVSATSIRQMVDAAAGINTKRGDMVDVQILPFSKTGSAAAAAALQQQSSQDLQQNILKVAVPVVIVLGVLLGLILLFRFLTRLNKKGEEGPIDLGSLNPTSILPEQHEIGTNGFSFMTPTEVAPPPTTPFEAQEELEVDRMRANIDRLAGASPQRTAEYLRNLMDEKQST